MDQSIDTILDRSGLTVVLKFLLETKIWRERSKILVQENSLAPWLRVSFKCFVSALLNPVPTLVNEMFPLTPWNSI